MKPQDIVFAGVVVALLFFKKPMAFLVGGLCCLMLAIPLFATWTFFTAERLTWYAALLFVFFCVDQIVRTEGGNTK